MTGVMEVLSPDTHAMIVRSLLEDERRRVAWALRNYPSKRDEKIQSINGALEHLQALEEKAKNEPIKKTA